MSRRLPPLNALRAFEAAARHMSFTRAATELDVTQAAISHQIRTLEDWLGISLFNRRNRALTLTVAGRGYLPAVRTAMTGLEQATLELVESCREHALTVATSSILASRWLNVRLPLFQMKHADLDIRLETSGKAPEGGTRAAAVEIRFGDGRWPGLIAERLFGCEVFPVCAPYLLERSSPVLRPEDLADLPLLHDNGPVTWRDWARVAKTSHPAFDDVQTSGDPSYSQQAALQGEGVALALSVMAHDDIRAGRLIKPFDIHVRLKESFYFVTTRENAGRPHVRVFQEWLFAEAGAIAYESPFADNSTRGGRAELGHLAFSAS